MVVHDPSGQFLQQIPVLGVYSLLSPEIVGLGEEGEADEPVRWRVGCGVLIGARVNESLVEEFLEVRDEAPLIEAFVDLVAHGLKGVQQSAGL